MRGRRIDVALSAVGLLAVAAALVVLPDRVLSWMDAGDPAPGGPAGSQPMVRGFACMYAGPTEEAHEYCRRVIDDKVARRELTTLDKAQAGGRSEQVRTVVQRSTGCPGADVRCWQQPRSDPGPADVDRARQALAAAGFPDAVVRLAGPADPAPDGSLVYAVRVDLYATDADAACVVGYHRGGSDSHDLVGTLSDGSCLPD